MCGIAGFVDNSHATAVETLRCIAGDMADTLYHRGPDDSGVWVDAEAGVALGHRRLSIIDLSAAGRQPMVSADGRLVITYNGEIYNFAELRLELEAAGVRFSGHSDTEVILEACAAWGVARAVERLIGMFAFALWNRETRSLTLVRDRMGIKPLYWGRFGNLFLFGSELKALRAHPGWTPEIDRDMVAGFLRHNYVSGPRAIYRGIRKLEPGCTLVHGADGNTEIHRYWDLRKILRAAQADRLEITDDEAIVRLEELLRDAVRRRMVADVPIGAFLSGGIDSSTVVALMQSECGRPVRTFTIGFHESGYDEAKHAKAVAAHLGTEHIELYVEPDHALEIVPRLAERYDEPFSDVSQIPTCLISELTRRHVTVALSGDGGDELFAGYNRYFWADALWSRIGWLPAPLRQAGAIGLKTLPPAVWDGLGAALPRRLRPPQLGDKVHKLADILTLDGPDALYRRLVSHWQNPDDLVPGGAEPHGILWDEGLAREIPDFMERMRFLDAVTYLPDDILTKVDRASMAVSLEARVPILDHRVVEFVWRLPRRLMMRQGKRKWLLRQLLNRYVPAALVERPKMGFGVPIGVWLRGPLRDWAEDLLSEKCLREEGLLNPAPVRRSWAEHLSGQRNWQYPLWDVLMLQAWQRHWMQGR